MQYRDTLEGLRHWNNPLARFLPKIVSAACATNHITKPRLFKYPHAHIHSAKTASTLSSRPRLAKDGTLYSVPFVQLKERGSTKVVSWSLGIWLMDNPCHS